MVKRALLVLVIAGGLFWWYEQGRGPELEVVNQVAAPASGAQPMPPVPKGAALRPAGGLSPKAWSVHGGKLVPGRALRDRFDSYLPLGRGVTMVEVRATLEKDALADLGEANSVQVLAIWDRYARLQNYDWQRPFNNADPSGWQATLNEQHQVRRQLLGVEWAEAFFGEDEAALQRRMSGLVATSAPKPASSRVGASAASGAPASAVMAAASAAASSPRDDWPVRSGKARQEWTHLTQDVSLDEGQRLIRIRQYMQQNFSASEAARLTRELQLP